MTIYEKIDALKQKLDALPSLTNGELNRLDEDFSVTYTYNTNAIEGNTLTERETWLLLKEGVAIPDKSLENQNDVIGHQKAYERVKQLASKGIPISEDTILDVHRFVLMASPENAAAYRTVDVHITNTDAVLTSATAVPAAIEKLLQEYEQNKQEHHLIDCVAQFHLDFEQIHPFLDGNGRVGRLLINYELLLNGYMPIDIKNTDKGRYYYCFEAYQGADENPMPMKQLVADYVLQALEERIRQVEQSITLKKQKDK